MRARTESNMSLDISVSQVDAILPSLTIEGRQNALNHFFTKTGKHVNGDVELYDSNPLPPNSVLLQRKRLSLSLIHPSCVHGYELRFWDAREFKTFYQTLKDRLNLQEGKHILLYARIKKCKGFPDHNHSPAPSLPAFVTSGQTYLFQEPETQTKKVKYFQGVVTDTSASLPLDSRVRNTHYIVLEHFRSVHD